MKNYINESGSSKSYELGITANVWALINSSNEVNAMIIASAKQLDLRIWKTNVGAQNLIAHYYRLMK